MPKLERWQLQEAKNKLSQVAEKAVTYGPQVITKHGQDAVVVVSRAEYDRLTRPQKRLSAFLANSPLAGSGLAIERDADPGRQADPL